MAMINGYRGPPSSVVDRPKRSACGGRPRLAVVPRHRSAARPHRRRPGEWSASQWAAAASRRYRSVAWRRHETTSTLSERACRRVGAKHRDVWMTRPTDRPRRRSKSADNAAVRRVLQRSSCDGCLSAQPTTLEGRGEQAMDATFA